MLVLNFAKFPVLKTKRLILRAHLISDANELFIMRTNEEVMRYIDRERPKNIQETETKIRQVNEGFNNGTMLAWVISSKENPNKMIGEIGFYRIDFANYRAEIGYMLMSAYWRKGLVSEALSTIVSFGFNEMNLNSISANINPENYASRQILLKHGFEKEAYFKEDYYFQGKFLDSEIYGLLKKNQHITEKI